MPYYAVARGRKPGIYATWNECGAQVLKFPRSIYKKFATESEAQNFIKERSSSTVGTNSTKSLALSKIVKSASDLQPKPLSPTIEQMPRCDIAIPSTSSSAHSTRGKESPKEKKLQQCISKLNAKEKKLQQCNSKLNAKEKKLQQCNSKLNAKEKKLQQCNLKVETMKKKERQLQEKIKDLAKKKQPEEKGT